MSIARPAPINDLMVSFPDQLLELGRSLERAAEVLALDSSVAARHASTLQTIDCIGQALAELAETAKHSDLTVAAYGKRG